MVPASGPSGARYSVVMRTGWARVLSGTGGWGLGVGGPLSALVDVSAVRVATTSATGASALGWTQPSRVTWTQRPFLALSAATRFNPNPCASSATSGPAGGGRPLLLAGAVG